MKRVLVFVLELTVATAVYAQTGYGAMSAAIREAEAYVNGCGSADKQWAVPALNFLSGNVGACNQHDLDYMTLGMSKAEADDQLYRALRLSSWTSVPVVAFVFWKAVQEYGGSAYDTAQWQAREEFKRIHHGNEWNSAYGIRWKPSDGHIPMTFPQCARSCSFASLGQTSPERDFQTDGRGTITRYVGSGGAVVIPSRIGGVQVQGIDEKAFYGCASLISVSIPVGVTDIGFAAFRDCVNLVSVSIPSSVTSIWAGAFRDCASLASVNIPSSVTSIEENTFLGCESLTSVSIPSSVTSIEAYAFYGCTSLASVSIPSGVTSIKYGTFYGCASLSSVSIPSSVRIIGSDAFSGCSSLTSITIPSSVIHIGNGAFSGCSSLISVSIPAGVASIEYGTFYGCASLRSIELSRGTRVETGAFEGVPGRLRYRD